jgi:hypothetical protein
VKVIRQLARAEYSHPHIEGRKSMFNAIRRVISEADDVGGEAPMDKDSPSVPEQRKTHIDEDDLNKMSSYFEKDERKPPAFVEAETNQQRDHNAHMEIPLTVYGDRGSQRMIAQQQQQQYYSSSSLSGDEDIEDEQLVNLQGAPRQLPSMNSRESLSSSQRAPSSQNSSRDWGWFEDVHFTDRGGNPDTEQSGHSDKTESKSSIDNGTYSHSRRYVLISFDSHHALTRRIDRSFAFDWVLLLKNQMPPLWR